MEGEPTQELSAIAMNVKSRIIEDIYHGYAQSQQHEDRWSRRHVHGLCPNYLAENGFLNEDFLVSDFLDWLQRKDIVTIFANDPSREIRVLNLPVSNIGLPCWSARTSLTSHQTVLAYKRNRLPIGNTVCPSVAHSAFQYVPSFKNSATEIAKQDYGEHCSLYDAFGLYLFYNLD